MKKVFRMEDLDCAHCAARMEEKIAALDGVISVQISFLAQKMTLETEDAVFDSILEKAVKICRKIEPDCRIIVR